MKLVRCTVKIGQLWGRQATVIGTALEYMIAESRTIRSMFQVEARSSERSLEFRGGEK
jgi:hypothetical protein